MRRPLARGRAIASLVSPSVRGRRRQSESIKRRRWCTTPSIAVTVEVALVSEHIGGAHDSTSGSRRLAGIDSGSFSRSRGGRRIRSLVVAEFLNVSTHMAFRSAARRTPTVPQPDDSQVCQSPARRSIKVVVNDTHPPSAMTAAATSMLMFRVVGIRPTTVSPSDLVVRRQRPVNIQRPFSSGLGGDGLGGRGFRGTRVGFGAGGAGAVLCASIE